MNNVIYSRLLCVRVVRLRRRPVRQTTLNSRSRRWQD